MNKENAEVFAVKVLGWLSQDDDLFPIFLGSTGMGIDDLKENMSDPAVLAGVLDFLLMDDEFVKRFCDSENLPYETPMQARASLPGGMTTHWT